MLLVLPNPNKTRRLLQISMDITSITVHTLCSSSVHQKPLGLIVWTKNPNKKSSVTEESHMGLKRHELKSFLIELSL